MNLLKFSLYAICLTALFVACEQNGEFSVEGQESKLLEVNTRGVDNISTEVCASLNVVPDWVKQNVTSEDYELWKIMSSRYEIDYSFLKEAMSEKRKKQIYDCIRKICTDIQSGKISKYAGLFIVASEYDSKPLAGWKLERLTRNEGDNLTSCNVCRTMYQHATDYYSVRVMLSLDYSKNMLTSVVTSMNPLFYLDADPLLKATYTGTNNCVFDTASKLINVSCGGTIRWSTGGVSKSKDFSEQATIIP